MVQKRRKDKDGNYLPIWIDASPIDDKDPEDVIDPLTHDVDPPVEYGGGDFGGAGASGDFSSDSDSSGDSGGGGD